MNSSTESSCVEMYLSACREVTCAKLWRTFVRNLGGPPSNIVIFEGISYTVFVDGNDTNSMNLLYDRVVVSQSKLVVLCDFVFFISSVGPCSI